MRSKNPVPVSASPIVLTVAQVAERLQIPVNSVYERVRFRASQKSTPMLPHRRIGKYLRFVTSEVDAWILGLPQLSPTRKRRYRRRQLVIRSSEKS
jgi:predicted DNA-binding transcriptional regulator AlpA